MATYYKYAERNAESRINWAEVGKDMTEMVREETRIRQEKKNAIDKQAREEFDRLSNPPMGEHQGFNEFTTKFAGDTQEYSLMVENLVKSGQMNLRDYTNIRANLAQGTGEAFSISEEYNAQYEKFLERQEIDPATGLPSAQAYEEFVMGTTQGFGNYSNHELFINPTDGRVNLGTIDPETGKVKKEIGSYIPVNQLRNRVKSKYDVYNLDVSSKGMVDQLGQIIDVEMRGGVKTLEDARNGDNFQDALGNFVASQLEIPTNVTSILTNTLGTNPETGNPYRFTDNPAEAAANPDLILSIVNPMQPDSGIPMPAFGVDMDEVLKDTGLTPAQIADVKKNNEGQMKAATEAMKTAVLSKVDVIETPRTEFNNEKDRAERGRGVRQTEQAVTNIADIYYGDQSELDAALGFVQGLDPSVSRVYIDPENPDNVLIERKDKKGNIVVLEPFVKGDNVEDFVKSVVTTLVPDAVDIEKALANSGIRNEDRTKTNFVGAAGESRTPVAPTIPTFDEKLDDEDEFSDTPSDVHKTAFEGANNHTKQANAETEFFSKVGITNAEVRAIDENEIDEYIVGGNINDNSVTEIFIPGVMSMPILIPDGNTSAEFEAINRFILNHIRNGGAPLTPNDFKELDIDEFSQYNNKNMSDGFLGLEWNDGLGPQPMSNENAQVVRTQPASTINTSGY